MQIPTEILLLTSGIGALQSFFLGIYLFTLKRGRSVANILLAFLLLAFAIRVIKSVNYYFSDGHSVSTPLMNVGFGANLAILPLLWLYLQAFLRTDFQFKWMRDIFHLAPAVVVIVLSPLLTANFWMGQHGYALSLVLSGLYLPFCVYVIVRNFKSASRMQRIWVICLTIGIAMVWAGYIANFMLGLVSYITAPVLFSFVVYCLSYFGLRKAELFTSDNKYQHSSYSEMQIDKCFERLRTMLDTQRIFTDPELTLPKVASQLTVSANLLSLAINKRSGQNFSDFINSYRIREAQRLLDKPESKNLKIAAIAFETGFNSLSVFNAAFKKFTKVTPSAYRAATKDR